MLKKKKDNNYTSNDDTKRYFSPDPQKKVKTDPQNQEYIINKLRSYAIGKMHIFAADEKQAYDKVKNLIENDKQSFDRFTRESDDFNLKYIDPKRFKDYLRRNEQLLNSFSNYFRLDLEKANPIKRQIEKIYSEDGINNLFNSKENRPNLNKDTYVDVLYQSVESASHAQTKNLHDVLPEEIKKITKYVSTTDINKKYHDYHEENVPKLLKTYLDNLEELPDIIVVGEFSTSKSPGTSYIKSEAYEYKTSAVLNYDGADERRGMTLLVRSDKNRRKALDNVSYTTFDKAGNNIDQYLYKEPEETKNKYIISNLGAINEERQTFNKLLNEQERIIGGFFNITYRGRSICTVHTGQTVIRDGHRGTEDLMSYQVSTVGDQNAKMQTNKTKNRQVKIDRQHEFFQKNINSKHQDIYDTSSAKLKGGKYKDLQAKLNEHKKLIGLSGSSALHDGIHGFNPDNKRTKISSKGSLWPLTLDEDGGYTLVSDHKAVLARLTALTKAKEDEFSDVDEETRQPLRQYINT